MTLSLIEHVQLAKIRELYEELKALELWTSEYALTTTLQFIESKPTKLDNFIPCGIALARTQEWVDLARAQKVSDVHLGDPR